MAETDNEQLKVNINGGIFPIWWLRKKSGITTDLLNDKVVKTEKIDDGAVTEEKLANKSVTEAKLADALKSKIDAKADKTYVDGQISELEEVIDGVQDEAEAAAQAAATKAEKAYVDSMLAQKVDKVTGKSLIDSGVAGAMRWVDNETVEITGNISPDDVNASGEVTDGQGNKLSEKASKTAIDALDKTTLTVKATDYVREKASNPTIYSKIIVVDGNGTLVGVIQPKTSSGTTGWLYQNGTGWRVVKSDMTVPSSATFAQLLDKLATISSSVGEGDVTKSYVDTELAKKAEKSTVDEIVAEVFPLTVSYTDHNAGSYEDGTSVIPAATASILRKGVDVSGNATFIIPDGATLGSDKKSWSAPAISTGTVNYNASVQQAGQTKNLPTLTYKFTYYRYRGEVSSIPTNYATAIKALTTKELSTAATLGATNLSANKYYLFAVKGSATLVCRESATNAIVSGCVTGTATINQENYATTGKSNSYSYILIPKSASNWTFKITNS